MLERGKELGLHSLRVKLSATSEVEAHFGPPTIEEIRQPPREWELHGQLNLDDPDVQDQLLSEIVSRKGYKVD